MRPSILSLLSIPLCAGLLGTTLTAQQAGDPSPAPDRGLAYAPAPRAVDGLVATPIDIHTIHAQTKLDPATKSAEMAVSMSFSMSQTGTPVFDLRQPQITAANLNGAELDPAKMAMHDFGEACGTMRILEQELEAGVVHVLNLTYPLTKPLSPQAMDVQWRDGGVYFDTWASDLNQGRYLEQWLPCNLLYDSFKLNWEFQLQAEAEHHLVTNADVEEVAANHWKLDFPATYTAFSPMVVIIPATEVEHSTDSFKLDGVGEVQVVVCRRLEADRFSNAEIHELIVGHMRDFNESMGTWRMASAATSTCGPAAGRWSTTARPPPRWARCATNCTTAGLAAARSRPTRTQAGGTRPGPCGSATATSRAASATRRSPWPAPTRGTGSRRGPPTAPARRCSAASPRRSARTS